MHYKLCIGPFHFWVLCIVSSIKHWYSGNAIHYTVVVFLGSATLPGLNTMKRTLSYHYVLAQSTILQADKDI